MLPPQQQPLQAVSTPALPAPHPSGPGWPDSQTWQAGVKGEGLWLRACAIVLDQQFLLLGGSVSVHPSRPQGSFAPALGPHPEPPPPCPKPYHNTSMPRIRHNSYVQLEHTGREVLGVEHVGSASCHPAPATRLGGLAGGGPSRRAVHAAQQGRAGPSGHRRLGLLGRELVNLGCPAVVRLLVISAKTLLRTRQQAVTPCVPLNHVSTPPKNAPSQPPFASSGPWRRPAGRGLRPSASGPLGQPAS